MNNPRPAAVSSAAVVIPCTELDSSIAFFEERLGFRLESIFPADDPVVAVMAGHGLRLQLEVGHGAEPATLRLTCDDPAVLGATPDDQVLTAPDGTRIELVRDESQATPPSAPPTFSLSRLNADDAWITGRAGMRYRDLIPGRQGGRLIASHISIPIGGPVPDYVHFHRVQFQMIYCFKGWVRVVYEDQGDPFVMHPGDCVLQPPEIRHRVLECSAGLEVVEVTAPAAHPTFADHDLDLPNPGLNPERQFAGQRFLLHKEADSQSVAPASAAFEVRDLGLLAATGGIAQVEVLRGRPSVGSDLGLQDADLRFVFVLNGELTIRRRGDEAEDLRPGDALVLPEATDFDLGRGTDETELLVVSLLG